MMKTCLFSSAALPERAHDDLSYGHPACMLTNLNNAQLRLSGGRDIGLKEREHRAKPKRKESDCNEIWWSKKEAQIVVDVDG